MSVAKPLLAIAIPTYNRAEHLTRLLERLSSELSGVSGVEVYISDNGSTDHTPEVVARFRSRAPDVHSVRQVRNRGPDENFCRLIDEVDAQYVWLLGDDDLLHHGALAAAVSLLIEARPDTVYLRPSWVRGAGLDDAHVSGPLRAELMARVPFGRRVNIYTTFISGWIMRTELTRLHPTRRFTGTSLVQLGWVLGAVEAGERHIYLSTPIVQATAGNSGGYSALTVFGSSFAKVTRQALGGTKPGRGLAEAIIRRAAVNFLPGLLWDLRTGNAGVFGDEVLHELESDDIGGSTWRRLVLDVVASADLRLARLALVASRVVAKTWEASDRARSVATHGAKSL